MDSKALEFSIMQAIRDELGVQMDAATDKALDIIAKRHKLDREALEEFYMQNKRSL